VLGMVGAWFSSTLVVWVERLSVVGSGVRK
jgi:hypothetical protein